MMIHQAASAISNALNDFLKKELSLTENPVVINRLVNLDGSIQKGNVNKLVLTLINIEEDITAKNTALPLKDAVDRPHVKANHSLYFLMSAQLNDYATSLKCLDLVLDYLDQRPVFDNINGNDTGKFSCELFPVNFEDLSTVYQLLGTKYQPSAVFKITKR